MTAAGSDGSLAPPALVAKQLAASQAAAVIDHRGTDVAEPGAQQTTTGSRPSTPRPSDVAATAEASSANGQQGLASVQQSSESTHGSRLRRKISHARTKRLETAGAPFGAAEYIGDITSNRRGNARSEFRLIVDEAFSSTLVNGKRVRVDLNRVGMWFADPADDDFCLGPGGGAVTPCHGDNEAGVQAFNSANTRPLPAP